MNGIKTISSNKDVPIEEFWFNAALNFSKEHLLQRTIQFEIDSVDKHGVAYGTILKNNSNFANSLLLNGLAFTDGNVRKLKYAYEYITNESESKKFQKGIWGVKELDTIIKSVE